MNLLDWINQGIDNLTLTSGPGIDALVSGSLWPFSRP